MARGGVLATWSVVSIILSSLQVSGAKVDFFFLETFPSRNSFFNLTVVVPSGLLQITSTTKSGRLLILGECAPLSSLERPLGELGLGTRSTYRIFSRI